MKKALLLCLCFLSLGGTFAAVEAGLFFFHTADKVAVLADHANTTITHFDTAFAPVLDCVQVDPKTGKKTGNPACLPSQLLATVGSIKAMAGAGAKAAPLVVKQFEQIATSAVKSSDNVAKLTANLSTAAKDTDTQIKRLGDTAEGLWGDLQPTLSQTTGLISDTRTDLATLQDPIRGTLTSLDSAAGHLSTSAENFSNLIPVLQTQIVSIGGSVKQSTDHLAELTTPHWYDRVAGYALNFLVGYRAVNPGANLTVKLTQLFSSHP